MRRTKLFGIPVLALVVLGGPFGVRPAAAQAKTARGTVTAVSDSSLSVKVGSEDKTFAVDSSTVVEAKGAGRRSRQAGQAGAPGLHLSDVVKTGAAVVVNYTEANGANRATRVRPVSSPGSAGSSSEAAASSSIANGTVKSISAGSLTIADGGKDRSFAIDAGTRVLAKGAGRKTTAAGGRIPITDLVHAGDRVAVTFSESGGSAMAKQIRITVKAP